MRAWPSNSCPMGCSSLHIGNIGKSEKLRERIWYEASLRRSATFTKSCEIVPRYLPLSSGSLFIGRSDEDKSKHNEQSTSRFSFTRLTGNYLSQKKNLLFAKILLQIMFAILFQLWKKSGELLFKVFVM